MDEVLKAMRGHVKGRDIKRVFIPGRRFHPLHLQDLVDLSLDFRQLRLALCRSYAAAEGVEGIQRMFGLSRFALTKKFPRRRCHRDQCTEYHRGQKDGVSPFVQKALLRAVVEGGSSGMDR